MEHVFNIRTARERSSTYPSPFLQVLLLFGVHRALPTGTDEITPGIRPRQAQHGVMHCSIQVRMPSVPGALHSFLVSIKRIGG